MKTTYQTVSSATVGNWLPVNKWENPFSLTLSCVVSSNANLTYKVQYTPDSLQRWQDCAITRSATTATLKLTNHGLTTNDWIIVRGSGDANLDGSYAVASVPDQNTITYTVSNSGLTVSFGNAQVLTLRVFDHPVITGKIANIDSNLAFPVGAVRLDITSYTAGYVTLIVNQRG